MRVSCTGFDSSSELFVGAEAEGANCRLWEGIFKVRGDSSRLPAPA